MAISTIPLKNVPPEKFPFYHKHVCPPIQPSGSPFDPVTPNVFLERNLLKRMTLPMGDGTAPVGMWIIENPEAGKPGDLLNNPLGVKESFPSPLIRTAQGDVVHCLTGAKTNTHTIHWHGIEPTPMNDGVGHLSFEISGNFTYQFATNEAGTYFYHCHKNTPLHFIMGLYGGFIVDPPKPATDTTTTGPPYPTGGPGYTACGVHPDLPAPIHVERARPGNPPITNEVIKYDREFLWVAGEMDTRWMRLGHDAFMQKCDAGNPIAARNFTQNGFLNNFQPDIFHVLGDAVRTAGKGNPPESTFPSPAFPLAGVVEIQAKVGQTLLIRQITAGFTLHQLTLPIDAYVIAEDGHPLGVGEFHSRYSRPFKIPANTPFRLSSARRWDMILRPKAADIGDKLAKIEFFDWAQKNPDGSDKLWFTARIPVHISLL
ncbi:MAG TPA: multicopper oxidase domain-containing protein [candidate division Zixibacteria bacterium]|nr:multicopper oxidase domain-containing protein [candidate division Zixibacteria bacterium]